MFRVSGSPSTVSPSFSNGHSSFQAALDAARNAKQPLIILGEHPSIPTDTSAVQPLRVSGGRAYPSRKSASASSITPPMDLLVEKQSVAVSLSPIQENKSRFFEKQTDSIVPFQSFSSNSEIVPHFSFLSLSRSALSEQAPASWDEAGIAINATAQKKGHWRDNFSMSRRGAYDPELEKIRDHLNRKANAPENKTHLEYPDNSVFPIEI